MPAKLRLAELTAAEARAALAARPVVLLPLGSLEDQGPHAPMGDYLAAEAIALRIAARASAAGTATLVAPAIPFGAADFFAPTPGGIALAPATFQAMLEEVLGALLRHGARRLLLLNGHGGNNGPIHQATLAMRRAYDVWIPSLPLWRAGARLLPDIVGAEAAARRLGHGADPLGSVAWHLFPELMRPDLIPPPSPPEHVMGMPLSGFGSARFEEIEIDLPVEIDRIAPHGSAGGDARLIDAATGAALTERLVAIGARLVGHLAAAE